MFKPPKKVIFHCIIYEQVCTCPTKLQLPRLAWRHIQSVNPWTKCPTWKWESGLLLRTSVCKLLSRLSCGGSCSKLLLLRSRCNRSVTDISSWLGMISRLLWDMFSTRRDLARQIPSGTSVRLLCDRSNVFNSSFSNISTGKPLATNALRRRFKVRRQRRDEKPEVNLTAWFLIKQRISYM